MKLYRLHDRRYLFEGDEFWKNFLITKRTFSRQYRFAGVGFNSGFYFSSDPYSAACEWIFYNGRHQLLKENNLEVILRAISSLDPNLYLLEASFGDLNPLASMSRYTDASFLRETLRGIFMDPFAARDDVILRLTMTPAEGGNALTDVLGYHALNLNGDTGIVYPSVRLLWHDRTRDEYEDLKDEHLETEVIPFLGGGTKLEILSFPRMYTSPMADPMENLEVIPDFCAKYFNVVFLGGVHCTRLIQRLSVIGPGLEPQKAILNPYFRASGKDIELLRTSERQRTRCSFAEAIDLGYLTFKEVEQHLEMSRREFYERLRALAGVLSS